MKKTVLFLLAVFVACATQAQQQYINFQGAISSSTGPVTNPAAVFEFTLPDFPAWTYTVANVPVTNGLYSVLVGMPPGLYDDANLSRRMVVKYNGNRIDTVLLLAPIERDPLAWQKVRDSLQWKYILSKPPIDSSIFNEIQTITLNGDTLKLSRGGGSVLLPHLLDTLRGTTVNGIFTVIDTSKSVMTTIPQTGVIVVGATNQVYWQSFRATANGKLRQLKLTVGASAGSFILNFYAGIGNGTPVIASKTFSIPAGTALQTLDVTVLSGQPFISVTNGQIFTFEIKPASGASVSVLTDPANPYLQGISSLSNTTDIPFELSIDKSSPSCLTFDANCQVGIGTDAPTAQLEVKGRIKDLTGFIDPPGSIMAYAGRNIPQGWLLCDGRQVSRTAFPALFDAIDTAWGAGNSSSTFNLPDMRGMFLRGVDSSANTGTANTDPDHSTRSALNLGGSVGNKVGSVQPHQVMAHSHTAPFPFLLAYGVPVSGYGLAYAGGGGPLVTVSTTNNTGGSETRPKNVYVYFIVKY